MSAVTSVLLMVNGTPAIIPPVEQPTTQEAVNHPAYPVDREGNQIPWRDLLAKDVELHELSSKCENPWLDPMRKNEHDATITGYPSYSILQFQPGTFIWGVKRYNAYPEAKELVAPDKMPDAYLQKYVDTHQLSNEDKVILAAIHDPYLQIYVARRMINDGDGYHWTCYNTLELAKKYPVWKKTATMTQSVSSKKLD